MIGLLSSRNQSQKSVQKNLYSSFAASSMRNSSKPACTAPVALDKRERIHRLYASLTSGALSEAGTWSPMSSRHSRVAFQILLTKKRYPSMRLGARAIRLALGGKVARVKRSA